MVIRALLPLLFFMSGCTTAGLASSTSSQSMECPEGAEQVYGGNGKWKCEFLRDVFLTMTKEDLRLRATTLTAAKLLRAFSSDYRQAIPLIIKQEADVGGLFFKVERPYDSKTNDEKFSGFHLNHNGVQFFMNTFPLYYSKKYDGEELYLRCFLSNYSRDNDIYKMLVFKKCQIINVVDK